MPRHVFKVLAVLLSVALAGSLVFVTPAVTAQEDQEEDTGQNGPSVSDILDSPSDYLDQDVSIDGTVGDSVTSRAFTITADNGDELLVVGDRQTIPDDISSGDDVSVDGTIREFTEDASFVEDLGVSPGQSAFSELEGEPVLVANTVQTGQQDQQDEDGQQAQDEPTVSAILNNLDTYQGQEVTVQSTVDDLLTPRAFTLESEESEEDLLVTGASDVIPGALSDDAEVQVTGVVHQFDPNDPSTFGDVDINPDAGVFDTFEDQPVLVASDVRLVTGDEDGDGVDVGDETPIGDIIDNPENFTGQQLTVLAEAREQISPQAWTVSTEEADQELLVLGTQAAIPEQLNEDALVRVTGTLQIFNPDDTYEVDGEPLDIDTGDDAFADFEGDPVLVASQFNLLAPSLGEMIENILQNPEDYYGEQVNLIGTVEGAELTQTFEYEGPSGFLGFGQETLLVVGATDAIPQEIAEDAIVQTTGTVRQFDPEDQIYEDIGLNIDDEFFNDFEGEPVVVADSSQVLAAERGETVENILEETDQYLGNQVTVAGAVASDLMPQAFTMEGTSGFLGIGGETLLVIGSGSAFDQAGVTEESIVIVQGTVQEFNPDETYEFNGEPIEFDDPDALSDYEGDPVVLASSVNVIAVD